MEIMPSAKISLGEGKDKMFKLLNEYEKSNLSIKEFCLENNIAPATFHYGKRNTTTIRQVSINHPDLQPFIYQHHRQPGYLLKYTELKSISG